MDLEPGHLFLFRSRCSTSTGICTAKTKSVQTAQRNNKHATALKRALPKTTSQQLGFSF